MVVLTKIALSKKQKKLKFICFSIKYNLAINCKVIDGPLHYNTICAT